METRTKPKWKLHNQSLVPVEAQVVTASLCPFILALGMAHWAGLAEMFVLAAMWWAELGRRKVAGGQEKKGQEAGFVSYPGLFKQFHC